METRKLQQVGGGTFTVSIPKKWANEQGLEAGTEIRLFSHADGSIVLRSSERTKSLEDARFEITGIDPSLVVMTLRAAHALGFETITLSPRGSFSPDQLHALRGIIRDFVGCEITAAGEDEITVRNLLDASDVSISQSVVQLEYLALSIHQRGLEAFVERDGDVHDRLSQRDKEADRLANMVLRHFNRSLVSFEELDHLDVSRTGLFDCFLASRELEAVADLGVEMARIGGAGDELPAGFVDDVWGAADLARSIVDDATTALLDDIDLDAIHGALDQRAELNETIDRLDADLAGASPRTISSSTRVLDAIAATVDHGATLADIAIRSDLRRHHG